MVMGRLALVWSCMASTACVEPHGLRVEIDAGQPREAPTSMEARPDRVASLAAAEQGYEDAIVVEPPPPVGSVVAIVRLTRPQPSVSELRDRLVGVLAVMGVEIEPAAAETWAEQAHPNADDGRDESIDEVVPGIVVTYDPHFDDLSVVHVGRLEGERHDTEDVPWSVAHQAMDALKAQGVLDPSLSFEDEIEVSFLRSGVKGPDGSHERWVDEIRFEANAEFEGIAVLDAGLRLGITPSHSISSIRVTQIEMERLDIAEVEASEMDLRSSFAEHVAGSTEATLESVVVAERRPVYVLDPALDSADLAPRYEIRYSTVSADADAFTQSRATSIFSSMVDQPVAVDLALP